MSGDFLDSNVFVYMFDAEAAEKRRISTELVNEAVESIGHITSFQVVQETLSVITRRAKQIATTHDALEFLEGVLVPLWTVHPSLGLYQRAIRVRDRYQFHFYDSLIVAAALEAGCDRLVSEDFQHGQRIEGLTFHNPFL